MASDSIDNTGSNAPDRNPDPITGAPGSHPLGTGIGTTSGALTGAALGAIGGPVGAAIGIIAGGIVGAVTGHKAGEYNDPTEDYSKTGQKHADPVAAATNPSSGAANDEDAEYWRTTHASNRDVAVPDADYDNDYAPAYRYGSEVSRHAATSGNSSFDELDNDARSGWEHVKGKSKLTYDQARSAISSAYDRGRTRSSQSSATTANSETSGSGI